MGRITRMIITCDYRGIRILCNICGKDLTNAVGCGYTIDSSWYCPDCRPEKPEVYYGVIV